MRLSSTERLQIKAAVMARDPAAAVYLHGSRANDALKGGDIDLLVVSDVLGLSDKLDILTAIKRGIGDQRIDLTLCRKQQQASDPFVASILPLAQLL